MSTDQHTAAASDRPVTPAAPAPAGPPTITSMRTAAEAAAFRDLNEEWIARLFTLEPSDHAVLDDPFGHVVEPGGDVLIARAGEAEIIGCIALVAGRDGTFELAKMAVSPARRGGGVGRALLGAAIARARELGATSLFLGSNTRLADAVHLYESMGFVHVPADQIDLPPYARADVHMTLTLA